MAKIDEQLAGFVEAALKGNGTVTRKKMFGGLCVLLNGNMVGGIIGTRLMLRVGPEAYEAVLKMKGAAPMTFTGRPLKGMVYADSGVKWTAASVRRWMSPAIAFVKALPKKRAK